MKVYLLLCLKATALFLLTCWSASFSNGEAVWMETIAFYFLAIYEVYKNRAVMSVANIAVALIFGRILLEIPIRIIHFYSAKCSFFLMVACVIAIILGCVAGKKSHMYSYFIGTMVLLYISNIWCVHVFDDWFQCTVGTGTDFVPNEREMIEQIIFKFK